jgi:hypothetical protein
VATQNILNTPDIFCSWLGGITVAATLTVSMFTPKRKPRRERSPDPSAFVADVNITFLCQICQNIFLTKKSELFIEISEFNATKVWV